MKRVHLAVLAFALVALIMAPNAARVESSSDAEAEAPAAIDFSRMSSGPDIVCQFNCNDGIGYLLDPCTDGSLGACCANAQPACANNGGLESGVCQRGRLGLPCSPL